MEQKCISSADIDSTGCHANNKSTTATASIPEKSTTTTASYLRAQQMSSQEVDLQLVTHANNVSDKKICESHGILNQNLNEKHKEDVTGRGCSISVSTPAADNMTLFKDDDSRSGSSDEITTPIGDLHLMHQHQHHMQQNDDDNNDATTTSTNTIQVIQDHHRCHALENTGGVGVGIYLETPVVDEQIVGLNSHDYEKAKPKRLSDEFLMSSEDCCDDDQNSSNDSNPLPTHSNSSNKRADGNVNNSDSSGVQRISGRGCNDMPRSAMSTGDGGMGSSGRGAAGFSQSQFEKAKPEMNNVPVPQHGGSLVFTFRNINIIYNVPANAPAPAPVPAPVPAPAHAPAPIIDVLEHDVQSMDAIERRDFEHEQRLTGGRILKSNSLVKNDRLTLEIIRNSNMPNQEERTVSSDSKCTYKDHSTTPTSSRHCSSRLTKSTAKINLSTSLSNPETSTNKNGREEEKSQYQQQQQQHQEVLESNSNSPNLHHKVQHEEEPGSSKTIQESSSSVAVGESSSSKNVSKRPSKLRSATKESAVKSIFELFSNANSNDSLTSEHSYSTSSSHSLSNLTKPQEPGCSGVSSNSSLNPEEDLLKKVDPAESNDMYSLQPKSDVVNEDDMPATSSSARCQYPVLKYIRNSLRKDSAGALNGDEAAAAAATASSSRAVPRRVLSPTSSMFAMASSSRTNYPQQLNHEASALHNGIDQPHMDNEIHDNEFDDETWADCEEGSDEEVCTCHKDSFGNQSKRDASDMLLEEGLSKDFELSSYIQMVSISEDTLSHEQSMSPEFSGMQRKRKFNETRLMDSDGPMSDCVSNRKRVAYDHSSTPRSAQSLLLVASPTTMGRRTPRSIIPTRDNPPPELQDWLMQFQRWSHAERILALNRLIEHCEPTQVRHMMKVIEPQFQRDFISLLPRELALQVLAYLDPKDLLRAAQTCRSWRFLCDDNLLWKEKCRKAQILTEPKTDRPKRGRAGNMPPIASQWKAAYMRQHIIESNWRSRPIREPKVLKGHDDHVITCLQFSGNRIVSGSDDNTLKVWSAVTGRCLRTLVGHTGGVWSSQMSENIIISGSTDRTLKVWDMETGACVHTLLGHTSTVRCMHLHGKKVVSGSRDATLRVWDIERGSCLHVLVGHLAAVRCVQYDGKLIVSGAYDYMVKIWHPERQECLHTLQGHTNRVYSLQFDGIHVVSGSLDTSIRVWDVETGNCKHTLMGHQSLTSGMELRQNILVSGNADSTVKVWDITNGQCLQTLSGPNKHQSAVTCLQFNSRFVITSSDDGTVKLWDVKTGEFIRNLVALDSGGSGGVVWRIRANDTKLICAVGSRNGTEETKLMVLDFDVEGACVKCS